MKFKTGERGSRIHFLGVGQHSFCCRSWKMASCEPSVACTCTSFSMQCFPLSLDRQRVNIEIFQLSRIYYYKKNAQRFSSEKSEFPEAAAPASWQDWQDSVARLRSGRLQVPGMSSPVCHAPFLAVPHVLASVAPDRTWALMCVRGPILWDN